MARIAHPMVNVAYCAGCAQPGHVPAMVLCPSDHRYWHRPCLEQRARLEAGSGDACFDGEPTAAEVSAYEARLAARSSALGL